MDGKRIDAVAHTFNLPEGLLHERCERFPSSQHSVLLVCLGDRRDLVRHIPVVIS